MGVSMRLEFVVASLVAIRAQAYAPIQWAPSQKNGAASQNRGFVVVPKSFVGRVGVSALPQELMVRKLDGNVSPNMIPYFSATQDQTISWDGTGLCLEANGDQRGDLVHVNRCSTSKPTQQWNWVPNVHGRYMIQLKATNTCIHIGTRGALDGVPLQLQDCSAKASESWLFQTPVATPVANSTEGLPLSGDIRYALIYVIAFTAVGTASISACLLRGQIRLCAAAANLDDTRINSNPGAGSLFEPSPIRDSSAMKGCFHIPSQGEWALLGRRSHPRHRAKPRPILDGGQVRMSAAALRVDDMPMNSSQGAAVALGEPPPAHDSSDMKGQQTLLGLHGGVYRKVLPPPAIALSSPEGRTLFKEALAAGTAECFFPLIEQFRTQDEPTLCGSATLVTVLNAFGMDPGRIWKGSWRWYHEQSLDCCKDVEDIKKQGLNWDEFLCLARCQGLALDAVRADSCCVSIKDFEAQCAAVCAQPCCRAVVVSYSRKVIGQAGAGHYSPIGAYHAGQSMVLVLDTARFKYPPHWVSIADMWGAMSAKDNRRSRGYMICSPGDTVTPSSCCTLRRTWHNWRELDTWANYLQRRVLEFGTEATAEAELWVFARSLPSAVASLVSFASNCCHSADADGPSILQSKQRCAAVMRGLRQSRPYTLLVGESQKRPNATLPTSLDSLALSVFLFGGLGLLDSALPCAKQAGVWDLDMQEHSEDVRALREELWLLQQEADKIRSACAESTCCPTLGSSLECCKMPRES